MAGAGTPQQVHLDLLVDGHEEAAQRAVALGATHLADGATWITLADPAGHPFDLCQRDGVGPQIQLFAVTFDAPDASTLAHFYADLLGMDVTYDGTESALVAGGGKSLMFQQVSDYTPPQWPDPAHPQQRHLDVIVDDPDHRVRGPGRRNWVPPGSLTAPPGSRWPTPRGIRSTCRFPDRGFASATAVADEGHSCTLRRAPRHQPQM